MLTDANIQSLRDKLMLAGLLFSKFDKAALDELGFGSFAEACNTIALAVNAKPASIKNYRDEFDPLFSRIRKGWHGRPMRTHCKEFATAYGARSLTEIAALVRNSVYARGDLDSLAEKADRKIKADGEVGFASRLITGRAAEAFFEQNHQIHLPFAGCEVENTTAVGCGFDFKLTGERANPFFAVEVKGMRTSRGQILMTEKEYVVAEMLRDRFFLYVVVNFDDKPLAHIYQNPLGAPQLQFRMRNRQVAETTWTAMIS